MKKMFFMALVAVSMIFASCGKTMSPEAKKAWEAVKEKAPALCSMEAIDQFESVEDWNAAVQDFNAAVQEMEKYQNEYSKEIADSFGVITKQFQEASEKAAAMIQQQAEAAMEEVVDEEGDEEEEEEEVEE